MVQRMPLILLSHISCHVMLCYVKLCCGMLCCVMSSNGSMLSVTCYGTVRLACCKLSCLKMQWADLLKKLGARRVS